MGRALDNTGIIITYNCSSSTKNRPSGGCGGTSCQLGYFRTTSACDILCRHREGEREVHQLQRPPSRPHLKCFVRDPLQHSLGSTEQLSFGRQPQRPPPVMVAPHFSVLWDFPEQHWSAGGDGKGIMRYIYGDGRFKFFGCFCGEETRHLLWSVHWPSGIQPQRYPAPQNPKLSQILSAGHAAPILLRM